MTVVTLGMVFCDTGKVSTKEERLEWPVTDEERNSEKGWERFQNEQICRLKIRRMKEEWAKDLVVLLVGDRPIQSLLFGADLAGVTGHTMPSVTTVISQKLPFQLNPPQCSD